VTASSSGGTSVGGPVIKNRTFYFGSFEDYQQTRIQLGNFDRTVPVPQFLDGDFSAAARPQRDARPGQGRQPDLQGRDLRPADRPRVPGQRHPGRSRSADLAAIVDIYRQSYQPMIPGRLMNNSARPPTTTRLQAAPVQREGRSQPLGERPADGSLIWTKRPRTLVGRAASGIPNPDSMGGPLSKARRQDVGSWQAR
jgi:hypothetical protein